MATHRVINLTGKPIVMIGVDGEVTGEFPTTDHAPVVEDVQVQFEAHNANDQPVSYCAVLTDGQLYGLPGPEPRVRYIVSMRVVLAACSRGRTISDLLIVEGEVSDGDGHHRGWRYLRSA